MSNPFQDQLLKTGLVSKKQAHNAKKAKSQKSKQQRSTNEKSVDETKLKIQQAAEEKAKLDRELNLKKEQQARQKALVAEIDQLITTNKLERSDNCEIAYNFEDNKKVKRIYVNEEMKRQIIQGKLGIVGIAENYELVARPVAEKIQQRDDSRVILFDADEQVIDENDPYAAFQIPDDLTW